MHWALKRSLMVCAPRLRGVGNGAVVDYSRRFNADQDVIRLRINEDHQDMAPDNCMEEILTGKVIAPFIPIEHYSWQTILYVLGLTIEHL